MYERARWCWADRQIRQSMVAPSHEMHHEDSIALTKDTSDASQIEIINRGRSMHRYLLIATNGFPDICMCLLLERISMGPRGMLGTGRRKTIQRYLTRQPVSYVCQISPQRVTSRAKLREIARVLRQGPIKHPSEMCTSETEKTCVGHCRGSCGQRETDGVGT